MIFNVVNNAVLWHWVKLVVEEEAGLHCFGWAVQNMAALFYTDDGLLALTRYKRLKQDFESLMDIF